mgnify:CR=1 FL=1
MGGNPEQGGYINLIFIALVFAVFYFFIIRPQSKRQKEIKQKVAAMKKGDKVVTSGGMIGQVSSVEDDSLLVEIDNNVKARFTKNSVVDVNPDKKEEQ